MNVDASNYGYSKDANLEMYPACMFSKLGVTIHLFPLQAKRESPTEKFLIV